MTTKGVNVSLAPERVSLGPADTAEFVATVHNVSDVVKAYSIDVQVIDSETEAGVMMQDQARRCGSPYRFTEK